MGKLIWFITFLIIVDLFFIVTGQLCATGTCSLGSIIFNAFLNLADFDASRFFTELIGDVGNLFNSGTGIAALLVGAGVVVGTFLLRPTDTILFIPVAFTLSLISSDFVVLFVYLASLNFLLAIFIMAPLTIIYAITVIDWLKNKD